MCNFYEFNMLHWQQKKRLSKLGGRTILQLDAFDFLILYGEKIVVLTLYQLIPSLYNTNYCSIC